MPGSSPAALGGQVHVEVMASDDALDSVDLAEKKKAGRADGAMEAEDRDGLEEEGHVEKDEDEESGDRGGDGDDDEGYSPERAREQLRASRRGERRAKTRSQKLERQMVRLAVEVEGLKGLAGKGMETAANDRRAEAQQRYKDAWNRRTKAFDEGKSADWNQAEADIKSAERDFAAATAEAAAAVERQRNNGPTAVLQDWLDDPENSWYDSDGGDADSKFAQELSRKVAADGFANNSQAHFDELTRRLKKQRPHLYNGKAAVETEEEEEKRDPRENGARERDRGPRNVVGGRRDQGNGGQVNWDTNTKVPKELIRNYQAAGYDVTDPKVKDRMMKKYNEVARGLSGGTINVG